MLSLRILTVDSHQCSPVKDYDDCYSDFRGSEINKVPVIRVVGNTPAGQKGCLHIHGVFPYLTVRCKDVFPGIEVNSSREYTQKLALEIDKALNVEERKTISNPQHVYKIEIVKRRCMYGYHEEMEDFLKIYFYNPVDVSRTATNMTSCKIMNKFIQPHEAHIPYILQFFIDYNLFGMNFLNTSSFKFRASEENFIPATSPLRNPDISHNDSYDANSNVIWDVCSLSSSQISGLPKETYCEIEADCYESDILNKNDLAIPGERNPGLKSIWDEEKLRRRKNNESSQISCGESQDREIQTESEVLYEKLAKILSQFEEKPLDKEDNVDSSFPGSSSAASNESLTEIFGLNNSNDKQLLQAFMDLANSQACLPEEDSILGTQNEVSILDEDEVDEIEMSQRDNFNFLTAAQDTVSTENLSVLADIAELPQFDGINDGDDDSTGFVPKLSKEGIDSPEIQVDADYNEEPPVLIPEDNLGFTHIDNSLPNITKIHIESQSDINDQIKSNPVLKDNLSNPKDSSLAVKNIKDVLVEESDSQEKSSRSDVSSHEVPILFAETSESRKNKHEEQLSKSQLKSGKDILERKKNHISEKISSEIKKENSAVNKKTTEENSEQKKSDREENDERKNIDAASFEQRKIDKEVNSEFKKTDKENSERQKTVKESSDPIKLIYEEKSEHKKTVKESSDPIKLIYEEKSEHKKTVKETSDQRKSVYDENSEHRKTAKDENYEHRKTDKNTGESLLKHRKHDDKKERRSEKKDISGSSEKNSKKDEKRFEKKEKSLERKEKLSDKREKSIDKKHKHSEKSLKTTEKVFEKKIKSSEGKNKQSNKNHENEGKKNNNCEKNIIELEKKRKKLEAKEITSHKKENNSGGVESKEKLTAKTESNPEKNKNIPDRKENNLEKKSSSPDKKKIIPDKRDSCFEKKESNMLKKFSPVKKEVSPSKKFSPDKKVNSSKKSSPEKKGGSLEKNEHNTEKKESGIQKKEHKTEKKESSIEKKEHNTEKKVINFEKKESHSDKKASNMEKKESHSEKKDNNSEKRKIHSEKKEKILVDKHDKSKAEKGVNLDKKVIGERSGVIFEMKISPEKKIISEKKHLHIDKRERDHKTKDHHSEKKGTKGEIKEKNSGIKEKIGESKEKVQITKEKSHIKNVNSEKREKNFTKKEKSTSNVETVDSTKKNEKSPEQSIIPNVKTSVKKIKILDEKDKSFSDKSEHISCSKQKHKEKDSGENKLLIVTEQVFEYKKNNLTPNQKVPEQKQTNHKHRDKNAKSHKHAHKNVKTEEKSKELKFKEIHSKKDKIFDSNNLQCCSNENLVINKKNKSSKKFHISQSNSSDSSNSNGKYSHENKNLLLSNDVNSKTKFICSQSSTKENYSVLPQDFLKPCHVTLIRNENLDKFVKEKPEIFKTKNNILANMDGDLTSDSTKIIYPDENIQSVNRNTEINGLESKPKNHNSSDDQSIFVDFRTENSNDMKYKQNTSSNISNVIQNESLFYLPENSSYHHEELFSSYLLPVAEIKQEPLSPEIQDDLNDRVYENIGTHNLTLKETNSDPFSDGFSFSYFKKNVCKPLNESEELSKTSLLEEIYPTINDDKLCKNSSNLSKSDSDIAFNPDKIGSEYVRLEKLSEADILHFNRKPAQDKKPFFNENTSEICSNTTCSLTDQKNAFLRLEKIKKSETRKRDRSKSVNSKYINPTKYANKAKSELDKKHTVNVAINKSKECSVYQQEIASMVNTAMDSDSINEDNLEICRPKPFSSKSYITVLDTKECTKKLAKNPKHKSFGLKRKKRPSLDVKVSSHNHSSKLDTSCLKDNNPTICKNEYHTSTSTDNGSQMHNFLLSGANNLLGVKVDTKEDSLEKTIVNYENQSRTSVKSKDKSIRVDTLEDGFEKSILNAENQFTANVTSKEKSREIHLNYDAIKKAKIDDTNQLNTDVVFKEKLIKKVTKNSLEKEILVPEIHLNINVTSKENSIKVDTKEGAFKKATNDSDVILKENLISKEKDKLLNLEAFPNLQLKEQTSSAETPTINKGEFENCGAKTSTILSVKKTLSVKRNRKQFKKIITNQNILNDIKTTSSLNKSFNQSSESTVKKDSFLSGINNNEIEDSMLDSSKKNSDVIFKMPIVKLRKLSDKEVVKYSNDSNFLKETKIFEKVKSDSNSTLENCKDFESKTDRDMILSVTPKEKLEKVQEINKLELLNNEKVRSTLPEKTFTLGESHALTDSSSENKVNSDSLCIQYHADISSTKTMSLIKEANVIEEMKNESSHQTKCPSLILNLNSTITNKKCLSQADQFVASSPTKIASERRESVEKSYIENNQQSVSGELNINDNVEMPILTAIEENDGKCQPLHPSKTISQNYECSKDSVIHYESKKYKIKPMNKTVSDLNIKINQDKEGLSLGESMNSSSANLNMHQSLQENSKKSNKSLSTKLSLKLNKKENSLSKTKSLHQNTKKKWMVDRRLFGQNKFALKGRTKERVAEIVSDSRLRIKVDPKQNFSNEPNMLSTRKKLSIFKNSFSEPSKSVSTVDVSEWSSKLKEHSKEVAKTTPTEQPQLGLKLNCDSETLTKPQVKTKAAKKSYESCITSKHADQSLVEINNAFKCQPEEISDCSIMTRHPRKCKEKALQKVKNLSSSEDLKESKNKKDDYGSDDSVTIIETVRVDKKSKKARPTLKDNSKNSSIVSPAKNISVSSEDVPLSPNIPKLKISLKWVTMGNNEKHPVVVDKEVKSLHIESDDSIQEIFNSKPTTFANKPVKRKRGSSLSKKKRKSSSSNDLKSQSDKKQCVAPLKINWTPSGASCHEVEKIKTLTLKRNPGVSTLPEYIIKKEIISDEEVEEENSSNNIEHLAQPARRKRGRPKKPKQSSSAFIDETPSPITDSPLLNKQSSFCIDQSSPGSKIRIVKKPQADFASKPCNILPENTYIPSHNTVPPLTIVNGVVIKQEIDSDEYCEDNNENVNYQDYNKPMQYQSYDVSSPYPTYNTSTHYPVYNPSAQYQSYNEFAQREDNIQTLSSQSYNAPLKIHKKRGRKPGSKKNKFPAKTPIETVSETDINSEKVSSFTPVNRLIARRESLRPRPEVQYFPPDQGSDEEKNKTLKSPKKRIRKHSAPGNISFVSVQDISFKNRIQRRIEVQELLDSCNSCTINLKKLSSSDISTLVTTNPSATYPNENISFDSCTSQDSDIEIISEEKEENNGLYQPKSVCQNLRQTSETTATSYNPYLDYRTQSTSQSQSRNYSNANYYDPMQKVSAEDSFTSTTSNLGCQLSQPQHDDILSPWNMQPTYDDDDEEESFKRQVPSPIDLNSDVLNSAYFSPCNYNIQEPPLNQGSSSNFSHSQPNTSYSSISYNFDLGTSGENFNYAADSVTNSSKAFNDLNNQQAQIEKSISSSSNTIFNDVNSSLFENPTNIEHYNSCNLSNNSSSTSGQTCLNEIQKPDNTFSQTKDCLSDIPLDLDLTSSKICSNISDYNLNSRSPYSQILQNIDEPIHKIPSESLSFSPKEYRLNTPPSDGPIAVHSASPLAMHSSSPLIMHSASPLTVPTASPLAIHSASPLAAPTASPLAIHSASPIAAPTASPLAIPTASPLAPIANVASPLAASNPSPLTAPILSSLTVPSRLEKRSRNVTDFYLSNNAPTNTMDSSQDDSYDLPSEKMDISPASDAFLMDAHAFSDNQSSPHENKQIENLQPSITNDDFFSRDVLPNSINYKSSATVTNSLTKINTDKPLFEVRTFDLSEGMIETDAEMHSLGDINVNSIGDNRIPNIKNEVKKYSTVTSNIQNTVNSNSALKIPDPSSVISNTTAYFQELEAKQQGSAYQVQNEKVIPNSYIASTTNESFSNLNSNATSTIINPMYEIPYNYNMIQVPAICEPVPENMFYSPVNRPSINYMPTVMVAEPTNHVSFLYNNPAPILVGGNPVPESESLNYLQNELVQSCSVSSTSDTDTQSNSLSALPQQHSEKLDILSVAVKECDIGEEFDPDNELMDEDKARNSEQDNFCRKDSFYFKRNTPDCISPDTNCLSQDVQKSIPYKRDSQKDFLGRTQHNFSPQPKKYCDFQIEKKYPNDFGVMETAVPSPQNMNKHTVGLDSSMPKSVFSDDQHNFLGSKRHLPQMLLNSESLSSQNSKSSLELFGEVKLSRGIHDAENAKFATHPSKCVKKHSTGKFPNDIESFPLSVQSVSNVSESNVKKSKSDCMSFLGKELFPKNTKDATALQLISLTQKNPSELFLYKKLNGCILSQENKRKSLSCITNKMSLNHDYNKRLLKKFLENHCSIPPVFLDSIQNKNDEINSSILNCTVQSFYDNETFYGCNLSAPEQNTTICLHFKNSTVVNSSNSNSDVKENTLIPNYSNKIRKPSSKKTCLNQHVSNNIIYKPKNKPPKKTEVKKWCENKHANNEHVSIVNDDSSEESDSCKNAIQNDILTSKTLTSVSPSHNSHSCSVYQEPSIISQPDVNRIRNKPGFIDQTTSCSKNLVSTPVAKVLPKQMFIAKDLCVSPIDKCSSLLKNTKLKKQLFLEQKPLKIMHLKKEQYGSDDSFDDVNLDQNLSSSQIDGPTLENSKGFKVSSHNFGNAQELHEKQHLTLMSLEVHVNTRNCFKPDPRFDSIAAVFYTIYNDGGIHEQKSIGVICIYNQQQADAQSKYQAELMHHLSSMSKAEKCEVSFVSSEAVMYDKLTFIIREWDPDILIGYEIQLASWGYLNSRASHLNINMSSLLSRMCSKKTIKGQQLDNDPMITDQTAEVDNLQIPGRIILNVWRLMRKEVNLNVYSFENVYYHVTHRRTPTYTFQDLTQWYQGIQREKVIRYYLTRVMGSVLFLEKFDLIHRTSELARLFGIQFYEVLSRGSQFRVESMMLRVAAPFSYSPISPSPQQRAHSRAPECFPLTLEPESNFYTDPVIVLDFQSLYPSMIIAYNYCFSTCLGRLEHFGKNVPFDFGCTKLTISPATLLKLKKGNNIHISPTGIAFVKASVRRGILPLMLEEILNTRIMVKQSLKKNKNNLILRKLLDARQLGLKLIANVTYGYTAANFSGRMPCVEVADSVVGKGRETLEKAIRLIENTSKWKAKVIYGDTDSLFILLPGRSKEDAFVIGQEMANVVTLANPKPVKLKFEKVYLPCVLQTKKRYVGYMYETPDQNMPIFDAKGIETVRRDTCLAASKILHKSLKILFETSDVSLVQKYVQKQFCRILKERVNLTDFIFAKEYRGINGYRPGACVPALEIAKKRLSKDPRSEPRVGERVPYVIVYGFPGMPIIRLVHEPIDLIMDKNLRINSTYYITRVISPPLERVFSLLKADIKMWYTSIAHKVTFNLPMVQEQYHKKGTLTQYFKTQNCPRCSEITTSPICGNCSQDPQGTYISLIEKISDWERAVSQISSVCASCTKSFPNDFNCISIDCPVLFKLSLAKRDLSQAPYLRGLINQELF